jgi:hypothetical protein
MAETTIAENKPVSETVPFDLPGPSDRTVILGQTGSGKTWFGVWLLSHQDIGRRPWIVFDYKREGLFQRLGRHAWRSQLTPSSAAPSKPGLHLMQPLESDDEAIDAFLWRVWQRGETGLYIDEAMMMPAGKGSGMRAILTQGRSLRIPVIALSQRPVEIDRYFFSESQFFAEFFLMDRDDRATLKRYTPFQPDDVPAPFHCFYYDAKRRQTSYLAPVPPSETFLDRLRTKAPRRLWFGF